MHRFLLTIIALISVIILLVPSKPTKCKCPVCSGNVQHHMYPLNNVHYNSNNNSNNNSMEKKDNGVYDLEQSTLNKGEVPESDTTDHTFNLWKSQNSHASLLEGRGCYYGSDNLFDYNNLAIRNPKKNSTLQQDSNRHLMSRFGGIENSK
jgi:hypothetical protein